MSAPDSKDSSLNVLLQQESLKLYRHKIAEKKAHLMKAQKSYLKASDLIAEYKSKIVKLLQTITETERELAGIAMGPERDKLMAKKNELQHYVELANKKLAPYAARLDKLTVDIKILDDEIRAINSP